MSHAHLRGGSINARLRTAACCAGVFGLALLCVGWASADSLSVRAMRACLQRSGVVTKSTRAYVYGARPAAFYLGPSAFARSTIGLVLVFKTATVARRDFYADITNGPPGFEPAELQAGNVEVMVSSAITPTRLAVVEGCVFGAGSRPVLTPAVPGQPVPTRANADLSPAVRRLVGQLHVFERAQTPEDVVGDQGLQPGYVPALTRLAATLPHHERVYFGVEDGVGRKADGSAVMQWWLPAKAGVGFDEMPPMASARPCCIGEGEGQGQGDGRNWISEALVPNDVARVTWIWQRTKRLPRLVARIATPDNLAVAITPAAYGEVPSSVIWYAASGRVLARS